MEYRLHSVIKSAINYIENNRQDLLEQKADLELNEEERVRLTEVSRRALEGYFYGKDGLRDQLDMALKRLENGAKPLFRKPLKIFDGGGRIPTNVQVRSEEFTREQVNIIQEMIEKELRRCAD